MSNADNGRRGGLAVRLERVVEPAGVACHECGRELAADSPELWLELNSDDEPIVYCLECCQRELGEANASQEAGGAARAVTFHIVQILPGG